MALKRIHENSGQLKELNLFSHEWFINMILKDLKIFSQNVQKNNFLINTILEVNQNFDIIFIQEPSWMTIRTIPSPVNCEGIPLVGIPNHPVMSIRTLTIFFSFILFYFIFSDFTFLFLFLYFIGKTMKKARDKEFT